jgi:hypothetical protein
VPIETSRAAALSALRKSLVAAPVFTPGNDGIIGSTIIVRTTDTADKIVELASKCGAVVYERVTFKRTWDTIRKIKSQAIRLVLVGGTLDEDLYLAGAIDMRTLRSRAAVG